MAKYDALIEINIDEVKSLSHYVSYCKFYFKPKSEEKIENYLFKNKENNELKETDKVNIDKLKKDFPFISSSKAFKKDDFFKFLKKNKSNETTKDFLVTWLKEEIMKENKNFVFDNDQQLKNVNFISGILTLNIANDYVRKLPPYSFIIQASFKLKQPYFSKDDDEFYIISNPILKEKVFKVPMIRGSGWKGALASAFKELINEKSNHNERVEVVDSYLRIFGAGSDSIKAIEDYLKWKSSDLKNFKEKLLEFILFELGLTVDKNLLEKINEQNSYEGLHKFLEEQISHKLQKDNKNLPIELRTHKGRAIFYPTYFDKLSLEVINPHDRRKRAGTQPIYYEVVPEGTEGFLQIIYIPFDGILKENEVLKSEAEKDLENLLLAIEKVSQIGIGAKTKLGWGTFEVCEDKYYFTNKDLNLSEDLKGKRWLKWQD